ncbi:hypothetical protein [Flagellimonas nanhaiensis]|uniref:DUF7793 domain-containing protein n=1 Tax=Flagellimonas nanhaiensis TaxID=2292706 RepID=A0A371JLF3_9FLAO|nr:hypothetical protein [Allomuricauda nanhaiensis]RDY57827.1 hypothetical protein DX873_16870 [Allomuricauda nanhaiensis]
MLNYLKNEYAEYIQHDGIVCITYKNGISINLDAAVKIVEDRLLFQEGDPFPVLCDIRGVREVDKSARDYLAMEGSLLIKAVAFIVEPPLSEILSKFYLKTSNPPIPTELFTENSEAMNFLNKYL